MGVRLKPDPTYEFFSVVSGFSRTRDFYSRAMIAFAALISVFAVCALILPVFSDD
jgi:hypothetical protein